MARILQMLLFLLPLTALAQRQQFSLGADELKIDTVVPLFTYSQELGAGFADSTYEVNIVYPEFAPLKRREARRYRKLLGESLPETPQVDVYTGVSRRKGSLYASFMPFVRRDGKNLRLTNFGLEVTAHPLAASSRPASVQRRAVMVDKSRLSEGTWVKISVPASGIYQLSDSLLLAAGFSQPERVRVYGYGGALQPEKLTPAYLASTDDLPEVPTCIVGGRRLFHAQGPVSWASETAQQRQLNYYADQACYFLSDADDGQPPLLLDSLEFVADCYPLPDDYHSLYEVDDFAWYHGGRNLYDHRLFGAGVARSYALPSHQSDRAQLSITMSYNAYCNATVMVGDSVVGQILIDEKTTKGSGRKQYMDTYMKAAVDVWQFPLTQLTEDSVRVTIRQLSGGNMRLDNIVLTFSAPRPLADFSQAPQPVIAGPVAQQNRHADSAADMIIVIPPSDLLREQAERLAQLHRDYDGMRVRVVRADELYNEFSSGTPDGNAYRRYLKMLYDRAESEADMPRFLLLFGDGVFDNRMHISEFASLHPDDLLLCHESENSVSETACYVSDDFFCMLDDGEGADIIKTDKSDVAVGRLPARTVEQAKTMVDKIYSYRLGEHAGGWQNTICLMGDDGNANMHMNDAESVAAIISQGWPSYHVRKVYWDAYERVESAHGYGYPDVATLIRRQMYDGALLMNYSGHGGPYMLSHEYAVELDDFKAPTTLRLPVWFTASCEVAPFDGYIENIGEQAMFNPCGGAIAFLGTTRTVYAIHNRSMNKAFMNHVLEVADGQPHAFGEAVRLSKNDQVQGTKTQQQAGINKLHFALLGDPALRLPVPTLRAVIDSINGVGDGAIAQLTAGDTAIVKGHIEGRPDFSGVVSLTVKDVEQTITCRKNINTGEEAPKTPLVYNDRPTTLFVGSDSVQAGQFTIAMVLPKDISYSDGTGLMLVHAYSDDRSLSAHGRSEQFAMRSAPTYESDALGPVIKAWLDRPDFANGDVVSATPHLHAELTDDDGINASEAGIGHHLELVVDGEMRYTYNLNSYFEYAFGDFRHGTLDFTLPALASGHHELLVRAWDVLNNSSVLTLTFVVTDTGHLTGILSPLSSSPSLPPTYFDLQGRRHTTVSGSRSSLVLYRTEQGKMKKKVLRGQ